MSVIQDILKPHITSPGKSRAQSSLFFSPESSNTSFQVLLIEKLGRPRERELHVDQSRGQISKIDETKRCLKTYHKSMIRCIELSTTDKRVMRLNFVEKRDENILHAIFLSPEERDRFLRLVLEMQDYKALPDLSYLNHTDVVYTPFRFFLGTWNLGEALPPQSIKSWLPEEPCDLYAFGFQESAYDSKQRTTETSEKDWFASYSRDLLQVLQTNLGDDYVLVENTNLWSIRLTIFAKQCHMPHILRVESGTVATGVGGVLGNKGGASTGFYFYQTPLSFVNCHLAARKDRVKDREMNYREILKGVNTGIRDVDLTNQYHHVFWMGDLNYRIKTSFEETVEMVKAGDWATLMQNDQLSEEMSNGNVFEGFQEGKIQFCPTYRYLRNCNEWSNKKGQSPSYCDRVLWHSMPELSSNVKQLALYPCMDIMTSDHRPIGSMFELHIKMPYKPSYLPVVCYLEISDISVNFSRKSVFLPEMDCSSLSLDEISLISITIYCPSLAGGFHPSEWSTPISMSIPSTLAETKTSLYRTFLGHAGWLQHEHLIVSVDVSSDRSGMKIPPLGSVLSLSRACGERPVAFHEDMKHAGKSVGTISGKIHLKFSDSNQL
eukprot:TRINITY_DN682_c0_g2_i1.p1 TRINITY_DN682_c0_g2~~TRINITY_DN682_c0_g2_i1.p1  ORF type:complete len:606 (-),score=83.95 TRINITY_DN682_c0_g2_i1:31-1848(-)